MTARTRTRTDGSLDERHRLGQQIRHCRDRLGMTQRDLAAISGMRQDSVWCVETAHRDVMLSTVVDMAAGVDRRLAVVAEYHLPLLGLSAAQVDALVRAADSWADSAAADAIRADQPDDTDPNLLAALAKLTKTEV